ncbi:MAG TPA: HIT family protein [Pyrinomonadaceae bacterium]|nr:HIT family protein [Pyrinomonadaceae bacterium]
MSGVDCIFCKISSGQAPASFVFQSEEVFAIMSLDQPNPYKVLVIPRLHIENIYDLSAEEAAHIFQATVKIARAVREASGCDGLNLVQSNGRAGQQDVFHFHLHLVPRFNDDGILLSWQNMLAERSELNRMAEEIYSKLEN